MTFSFLIKNPDDPSNSTLFKGKETEVLGGGGAKLASSENWKEIDLVYSILNLALPMNNKMNVFFNELNLTGTLNANICFSVLCCS